MTTVRDPAAPSAGYQRLLIIAPFTDLASRLYAENAFVAPLATRGVHGLPFLAVFPPTRTYSKEESAAMLRNSGADGALIVTLTDAYTQQVYVPRSSTTTGTATLSGDMVNYRETTQHNGGYYVSLPRVQYELRLVDVATGQTTWLAASWTRGNAFAQFDALIQSGLNIAKLS
jgi:hypothetical protein